VNTLILQFKKVTPLRLIVFAFGCLALLPNAQAVSPPPDGGYPGGNTAEGQNALLSLTSGTYNTTVGLFSLSSNTEGNFNTAIGAGTLLANTEDENTATGAGALLSNTSGNSNTANGAFALFSNTEAVQNTASGDQALFSNATGNDNTADGFFALLSSTTGGSNSAVGAAALRGNTTGSDNTALGRGALRNNTIGSANIAIGREAGVNQTSGSNNIYIGAFLGGIGGEVNQTYIGNINTTSVNGGDADFVTVNLTTGLLGHASSSRRCKEDIKAMDSASEALYQLKPVTYRYKREIDHNQSLDYGLIAEEVADIDPNLTVCNKQGEIESVRYNAINAMLLNEFLKEHRKVQELEGNIALQQKQIEALTVGLQKVSAQLEASKPAPQVVNNP
jgi:hypothetical protein